MSVEGACARGFRFEQLDRLPEDISVLRRKDELVSRAKLWIVRLGAEAL